MKTKSIQPFLKWAGGKRQLLPSIRERMPEMSTISNYYEPFLGGGAVFLDLKPNKAVVNDFNEELINAYRVIKTDVEQLIKDLEKHENTEEYYYRMRAIDRSDTYSEWNSIEKASRLIYLNKTGYNGLYRVNSKGHFNTPYGRYKNPNIVNKETLLDLNRYFNSNNIKFLTGDFEGVLRSVESGSFVYIDPPYVPLNTTVSFTGYTNSKFGKNDQIRLKNVCDELNAKNVKFLLSNSKVDFIEELYKDYNVEIIAARRSINSVGSKRGKINEVLISNYTL